MRIAIGVLAVLFGAAGGAMWWTRARAADDLFVDAKAKASALQGYLGDVSWDLAYCSEPAQKRGRDAEIARRKFDVEVASEKVQARLSPYDKRVAELRQMSLRELETERGINSKCFDVQMRLLKAR